MAPVSKIVSRGEPPWLKAVGVLPVPEAQTFTSQHGGREVEEQFERFWKAKPRRQGSNPKDKARQSFLRSVVKGVDPEKIISAASAWAKDEMERGKLGTEYVPMAVTWLNQTRFNDYQPMPATDRLSQEQFMLSKGWKWDSSIGETGSWVRVSNA